MCRRWSRGACFKMKLYSSRYLEVWKGLVVGFGGGALAGTLVPALWYPGSCLINLSISPRRWAS